LRIRFIGINLNKISRPDLFAIGLQTHGSFAYYGKLF